MILQLSKFQFIGRKLEIVDKRFVKLVYFIVKTQHHPDCECYQHHEFFFKGRKVCSGCYGTITGLVLNFMLLSFYFAYKEEFVETWW